MVKELLCNKRFIGASMVLPSPDEVAMINGIGEHAMDTTAGDFQSIARTQALIPSLLCDLFEGIIASGVPFKEFPDERCPLRVRLNGFLLLRTSDITVPQRRCGRIDP